MYFTAVHRSVVEPQVIVFFVFSLLWHHYDIKADRTQNTTLQTNAGAQDLGDRRLCAALPSASAGRGVLRPRQRMNRGHAAVYDDSFYHSASDEIHGEASRAASAGLEVVASGLGAARPPRFADSGRSRHVTRDADRNSERGGYSGRGFTESSRTCAQIRTMHPPA